MRPDKVKRRRVVFIGVEGRSDRAFATFLQRRCDEKGLHLHLIIKAGNGGDSVSIVEDAARYLKRHSGKKDIGDKLVLLDSDRIVQDRHAGRDVQNVASKEKLEIIFFSPNLEGLLLRLHRGYENRQITGNAMRELRKVWPEYSKKLTADQLDPRFGLSDLVRAARYDKGLQRLLEILGL